MAIRPVVVVVRLEKPLGDSLHRIQLRADIQVQVIQVVIRNQGHLCRAEFVQYQLACQITTPNKSKLSKLRTDDNSSDDNSNRDQ